MACALALAGDNAGRRRAAKMAMTAITTSNSIIVKPWGNPPLTPPRRGTHPAQDIFACPHTFLRITEGGGALCESLPHVAPIPAAGGHDSALKNAFNRHKRSHVSPAVD